MQNRLEHNHERRAVVKMMGLNPIKDSLVFFLNGGLCKMMACAKQCLCSI